MLESIITLSIVGFIAGVVFSMPIAGPVSIVIVSKAFEGKLRFCSRTAIGASIIESMYVFVVVYGITTLYVYYQPAIPYLLLIGGLFVIFVGIRISKRKIDFKSDKFGNVITDKIENRGGMRTGVVLNLTNPSLFFSWLVASFITLSFVSSLGFQTGGLDIILNENVNSVSEIAGPAFNEIENFENNAVSENGENPENMPTFVFSIVFALSVGLGAMVWLDLLARLIIRHRDKIHIALLNRFIQILGISLVFIGGYLGFRALSIFVR